MPTNAVTADILRRCEALGFAGAGVAPAGPSLQAEHLRAWLGAGKHGDMDYMLRDVELRENPALILTGARSFIVVADRYAARGSVHEPMLHSDAPAGRVARYAQGRNYHAVMKKRLHAMADALRAAYPGSEFRTCVDTAPVLERELAASAGIGWQAKNAMVIHPRLGSYFFLGVVATTLELPTPANQRRTPDHCGTCTRCIDACPTGAIEPYKIDGSRCVSYLTIEHRGVVDPSMHKGMGDWLFGCDICQEVCPHNSVRREESFPDRNPETLHPAYRPRTTHLPLLDVLGWNSAAREEAFKVSAMKRATLGMMKRNALIAAGNALGQRSNPALLARVREVAGDSHEPEFVRQTARDVLAHLGQPGPT
ncbi:MAG: tRNA epoxyqueuosine(34) reductase QueG [Phycisphaeraceae bacterium]|nr:tRNA epoxyqueuosine(34) reductase QueG [Phycisphaeraceae bacterium]